MILENIKIKIVSEWPEKDIINLYKAGGWWKEKDNPSDIKALLKGSFAVAVAIDVTKGIAIGMGRLLSDGISDAYIQDLVVLPKYRGCGIGARLMNTLLSHCVKKGISWIGLISEPGQENFYKALKFKTMKNYFPMRYQPEK